MPRNDLTGHLYRQRMSGKKSPAPQTEAGAEKSRFAFDGFTFFVGCLLAAALLAQFALMAL